MEWCSGWYLFHSYDHSNTNLLTIIMKQQNPLREEAKQIIDDYYHLMNSTFGARYQTAKHYAIDMIQRRIDTPDLPMEEKERWFFIKQEMLQL